MTRTRRQAARAVVSELISRLGPDFTAEEIERCVDGATRDLKGSISPEALPEMAARLAVVRLSAQRSVGER